MTKSDTQAEPQAKPAHTTRLLSELEGGIEYTRNQLTQSERGRSRVLPLLDRLSEKCSINSHGGVFWFTTNNRADLQVLFTLAARWAKDDIGGSIRYRATVDDVPYWITAEGNALPPTCRLIEKTVVVPEHTVTRLVVECAKGVAT